jgi:hypothetical protein
MSRTWSRLLLFALTLMVAGSLAACGDDHKDHENHENHETPSGDGK